jgi:hypothetical protein
MTTSRPVFPGSILADSARAARVRSVSTGARRLRAIVGWAMAMPLLLIALIDSPLSVSDRLLTGVLWALCLLPAWLYLGKPAAAREPIPFFPFIGLEFGLYFALQGIIGTTNVYGRFELTRLGVVLTPEMYSKPIFLTVVGWSLLLTSYYLTRALLRARVARTTTEWDRRALARWGFRLLAFGVVVEIVQRVIGNPIAIRGVLYFGGTLSLLALSLLTILSVRKQLTHSQNIAFYIGAAVLLFLRAGTSATAQLVIIALTILFSVWVGGGKLTLRWIWIGLVAALVFVSIRGVANEHRRNEAFASDQLPLVERSSLIFALLAERVEREGVGSTVLGGWETVAGRAALLDLFTDVVRQTPDVVPHWNGDTYVSLVGGLVPRFLWPDKPMKVLGWAFGQRYGYLAPYDFTTTINMPYLIEFYANFGEIGVYLGMLLVGFIYCVVERIANVPRQGVLRSVVGMGLLMPLINIESDFSLVFGGLFLTGFALYVLYRLANLTIVKRRVALRPVAVHAPGVRVTVPGASTIEG